MRRRDIFLAVTSVLLVAGMSVGPAWAYFTDYSKANGSLTIKVKPETEIEEYYTARQKHVTIRNTAAKDDQEVYVRARVFAGENLPASVTLDESENWSGPDADGWYNYSEILYPKGSEKGSRFETDELIVTVELDAQLDPDTGEWKAVFGDNYNVIVVYESTPVRYDTEGKPYADWSNVINHKTITDGGE